MRSVPYRLLSLRPISLSSLPSDSIGTNTCNGSSVCNTLSGEIADGKQHVIHFDEIEFDPILKFQVLPWLMLLSFVFKMPAIQVVLVATTILALSRLAPVTSMDLHATQTPVQLMVDATMMEVNVTTT